MLTAFRYIILFLGLLLSINQKTSAFTPSPELYNGKSEFENVLYSPSLSIVVVVAAFEGKNSHGATESTYDLRVERTLRGLARTKIRLYGGRSDFINGYPQPQIGVEYLLAIVPWGPRDELTGDRISLIPMPLVKASRALAKLADVKYAAKATPIWPRSFVRTFPARLHAWQQFLYGPTFATSEQQTLGNLHGILNEWNTFRTSSTNVLEVVQIADAIQYGNGRNEYWGERTLAEIQQYFGYNASGACGVAFTRSNPLETDVVLVQGCVTPGNLLHELGHFMSLDHPFEHLNVTFASVMDYSCAYRVSASDMNTLNSYYPGRFATSPDIILHPRSFGDSAGASASCGFPSISTSNNGQFTTRGGITIDNPSGSSMSIAGFRFELIPRNSQISLDTPSQPQRPSYPQLSAPLAPIDVSNPITIQAYSSHSIASPSIIGDIRFGSETQRAFGNYIIGIRPYGLVPTPTKPFAEISDFIERANVELGDPQPLPPTAMWTSLPFEVLTWQPRAYSTDTVLHAAFSVFLQAGDSLEIDFCRAGALFETATGYGVPTIDYTDFAYNGAVVASFNLPSWTTPEALGNPCFPGRANWPSRFETSVSRAIYVTLGVNFEALNPFQTFDSGMSRIRPMYRVISQNQSDPVFSNGFE